MGLTEENRKDIVEYRIERAFVALEQTSSLPHPSTEQNSLAGNKSFPRWEKTTSGNCKKHIQETFDGLYRTRDKQTK